jgi:hypothetical protein
MTTSNPETLTCLLEEIKAINERAKASGRDLLGQAFASFFERCPEAYAVVWTQYAPYFNDGDPCVFSVHEAEVRPYFDKVEPDVVEQIMECGEWDGAIPDDPDELDWHGGECCMLGYGKSDDRTPSQQRVSAAWAEMLSPAFTRSAKDIMQSVFGDDCKVVATRAGFHTGEYSHD